eukprot:TRINITY_DN4584_c0_g1_i3.p1 TRINITY_DN4584_c0_g1~~TRINITY_DN4584_c0_g1_i3.p1  ORF type:complete len:200 (-),score=31.58 TRINITY_DN4584_c0_g1_i3:631-1230(-)
MEDRVAQLIIRVERAEARAKELERQTVLCCVPRNMQILAQVLGSKTSRFLVVPSDYYQRPLEGRRQLLKAPSIHHLCKSIVLENTHCTNTDCSDPLNSRYYCIVLQYTSKLNSYKVMQYVRTLKEGTVSKQYYNFRLAPEEISCQLTGYDHNAVTPLGMKTKIPVILSESITKLQPGYFFLGGGIESFVCFQIRGFSFT